MTYYCIVQALFTYPIKLFNIHNISWTNNFKASNASHDLSSTFQRLGQMQQNSVVNAVEQLLFCKEEHFIYVLYFFHFPERCTCHSIFNIPIQVASHPKYTILSTSSRATFCMKTQIVSSLLSFIILVCLVVKHSPTWLTSQTFASVPFLISSI